MKFPSILFSIILLFPAIFSLHAKNKDDIQIQIKATCLSNTIYQGDSTIIFFQIYTPYPILDIDITSQIKIKGCIVRQLPNKPQTRCFFKHKKIIYATIWNYYSVKPIAGLQSIKIPPKKFTICLKQPNGFKKIQTPFGIFKQPQGYKKKKYSVRSNSIDIQIKKRPRPTIQELQKAGKHIL